MKEVVATQETFPVTDFIMFIAIVLTLFSVITLYVFFRGWSLLPDAAAWRWGYLALFVVMAPTYILAKALHKSVPHFVYSCLTWVGSIWLAIFFYVFIFTLMLDLIGLLIMLFRIPVGPFADIGVKRYLALGAVAGSCLLLLVGYINANTVRVRSLAIELPRKSSSRESLTVAFASDIHLGAVINSHRLAKIVRKINDLKPDLILLGGDIMDGELIPLVDRDLASPLAELQAPYGVFAVTGNHEYIAGVSESVPFLSSYGIKFLQDEAVTIADSVYLVGRKDRTVNRFTSQQRLTLQSLLDGRSRELPIMVLDHQPFDLGEAEAAGVDLQLSGHTHRGQVFPIQFITSKIYECDWGYLRKGATQYYISSGAGYWGPPMRIGSVSEVVKLAITFK